MEQEKLGFNPKGTKLPGAREPKPIDWGSSNLWTNLVLLLGVGFTGFIANYGAEVQEGISSIFGLIALGKSLRDYFKGKPTWSFKNFAESSNSWGYLGVILTAFLPQIPAGEFIPALEGLAQSIQTGSLQNIIFAAIPALIILYNVFIKKKDEKLPTIR